MGEWGGVGKIPKQDLNRACEKQKKKTFMDQTVSGAGGSKSWGMDHGSTEPGVNLAIHDVYMNHCFVRTENHRTGT